MEVELQLLRGFAAGWRILPVPQCLLDCIYQQWMAADNVRLLDVAVRRDHDLHLHDTSQMKPLRCLGIHRNWIGNDSSALLCLQV